MDQQGFRTSEKKRHAALRDFEAFELPSKRLGDHEGIYTAEARSLAETIRAQCVPRMGRLAVAEAIVEANGWNLKYKDVTKVGSQDPSSIRSILIPLIEGGFTVVVNTFYNPDNNRSAALIAHEIGHSFFYNHSIKPPIRTTYGLPEEPEERFCNEFAFRLTDVRL